MDQFELTKIVGAVLTALLLIFGMRTIVSISAEGKSEKPGYVLEAAAPEGGAKNEAHAKADAKEPEDGKSASAGGGEDIVPLLAKANADAGKATFKKCQTCHVAEKGKKPTVGPNLWGVVNRPKGSTEGFAYSDAMKSKGGDWTFADLGHFIRSPKSFVSGTKMQFAGLSSPEDEANVIAYLATLADTPVPLPK